MKEWYLLNQNSRPNSIGGFESDAFVDYKEDAFMETLTTDVASTVTLYNSSLSEGKQIRCIVRDNMANTYLKSMERNILAQIGTLKAGMYIYFEDNYWLIVGRPGNNKVYEKATAVLCQYKIKWQNDDGDVIERYGNFTSASKYDIGESVGINLILTSNNFTILLPEDDDVATLDGRRVFIDRNTKNPKKVFNITRSDDVLYLYGESHGGILSFICDKDEMDPDKDRPDLGLCDYVDKSEIIQEIEEYDQELYVNISGGDTLRVGRAKSWSVAFKNQYGREIPYDAYNWNIASDFDVGYTTNQNKIKLTVDDEKLIGTTLLLQVFVKDKVMAEKNIQVIEGF